MDTRKKEPEDYVTFGTPLVPLEEDDIAQKKPIRIEDQEVRDENGRRRFHGAFTGGFSAGYYNTVDTKEGWRPAEFKSSRSDRQKKKQKPEDFMDQEDLGAFGIAPQVLRAKDDYGEGHVSRKRLRPVFALTGAIPGLPALHSILNPVKDTIGIKLLRAMGWKPNQGVGERITKKQKRERRKKNEETRTFGCGLPPSLKQKENRQQLSDGDSGEESDEQLYAPDDVPAFLVKPKTNTFGLGYTGLMPDRAKASAPKSGFVLFEPTLKLTDKKKKLQIAGQAFGVGAFEDEDEDIYGKDDMSQYDFELGGAKPKKKNSQLLALPCSDVLDGFVRATRTEPSIHKHYPPPVVPRDFVPIHRSQNSRFDLKPITEAEMRGLGRHDLNAHQRASILNEVLEMPLETQPGLPASAQKPTKLMPEEVVAQALVQIRKNIAAQQEKSVQVAKEAKIAASIIDPDKEAKVTKLKAFIETSRTISTFQPFARDMDKQYRFEAYCILSKSKRLDEFHILQPDTMTAWEREREEVEFDRSLTLYRPLTATMQNRFTSGGHVEENIQGGLVAQIESFLPQEAPQPKKEPVEKDPAKRAARRKQFGPLTRTRCQWKPDRLLCIRFNVPNPFPSAGDSQDSSKFTAKGVGAKFSIFDVLNAGPQVAASFISSGYENVPPGPVQGPSNKVQELEWDKAEKGELEEKAEVDIVPEAGPSTVTKEEDEEERPYERPPMDIFKAIFADSESESEEEEVEEEKKEEIQKEVDQPRFTQKIEQVKPPVEEEMDDAYGPQLPTSTTAPKVAPVNLATTIQAADNQEEWVEKSKKGKKKKEKKKSKKKKDKKDKKNKKRKRHHSDSSSSSSDDDVDDIKILKKIATEDSAHAHVPVATHPKNHFIILIHEGEDKDLICIGNSGSPNSQSLWLKNGVELEGAEVEASSSMQGHDSLFRSTLTIRGAQQSDNGIYTCILIDETGKSSLKTFDLLVSDAIPDGVMGRFFDETGITVIIGVMTALIILMAIATALSYRVFCRSKADNEQLLARRPSNSVVSQVPECFVLGTDVRKDILVPILPV
uniref:EOG090X013U n=1 Tax=Ceriodaphnia reticulata TaxID=302197 RepID=A0A4Y7LZ92_9CRUS|nr:EOG090X013U [Ceriodaphnia reticulata]SVE72769.1 EOG090X013U [Ceriodaphnia reticulata]